MTDASGEIISVTVDQEGRPFFYVSHQRAAQIREAPDNLGFRIDSTDSGKIVRKDEMDESDEGDEVVAFEIGSDPNVIQDLLDELTWSVNRVVKEIHP